MVPNSAGTNGAEDIDDLREHDREVLEFLCRDPSAQVAFQGIRRRLGIHPEQLSRALHRLAQDDLVQKTELGYRVTRRGMGILSPGEWVSDRPGVTVLQTHLPADLDLRALVAALRGTWVGPLRWYSFSESPEELRLSWALEDESIQLETRVRAGQLAVVAHVASHAKLDEATRLGHLLFRQIASEVSRGPYGALVA
jgi:DNA-binding Lrp family transcriptional regulator